MLAGRFTIDHARAFADDLGHFQGVVVAIAGRNEPGRVVVSGISTARAEKAAEASGQDDGGQEHTDTRTVAEGGHESIIVEG